MSSIDRPPTKGNLGPFDVHIEVAPERPEPPPIPRGEPVGYGFDPIPSAIRSDRRLKPIDHLVLAILISFAVWRRDSCWTTVATIAARLPAIRPGRSGSTVACDRTVQRSIDRLKAAGYIRHKRVPKPDPDDPRNLTGWRFYFNFVPIQTNIMPPPREVTKTPGEVTKGSPDGVSEVATTAGEVTFKSGDSLVTQDRGEIREQESKPTFNVANDSALATWDGRPTVDAEPAPSGESLPAAIEATAPVKAAPAAAPVWTPRELAERFFRRMRDRGLILEAAVDGKGVERIKVRLLRGAEDIRPDEVTELLRLKPALLAFLKREPVPGSPVIAGPPGPAAEARPAPKVREPHRVRDMIGRLAGNPDPAIEATACRAIAEALRDHKPESLALFLGLAGDVRRGELAEAILHDAFEAACGPKARNRGAVFTDTVKRRIHSARSTIPPSRGAP